MDNKHILVSLGDDKIKQIGEAIGSKTCNQIIDVLSDNELTATEISEKLKAPLNTIDYNIKKLVKTGLIEKSSHMWSIKGKKMPTYKISNKKIIISPKKAINKLFATTIGITGLIGLTIREFTKNIYQSVDGNAQTVFKEASRATTDVMLDNSQPALESMAMNAGLTEKTLTVVSNPSFWQTLNPWQWFLFGAWLTIIIFFAVTIFNERRGQNENTE